MEVLHKILQNEMVYQCFTIIGSILFLIILNAVRKWLNEHIESKRIEKLIDTLYIIIRDTVIALNEEKVKELKKRGKFDEIQKKNIKAEAIFRIENKLSDKIKKQIKDIFGEPKAVISDMIEHVVRDEKETKKEGVEK